MGLCRALESKIGVSLAASTSLGSAHGIVPCTRDFGLTPCLCQGCVIRGTQGRRRMEASPGG